MGDTIQGTAAHLRDAVPEVARHNAKPTSTNRHGLSESGESPRVRKLNTPVAYDDADVQAAQKRERGVLFGDRLEWLVEKRCSSFK